MKAPAEPNLHSVLAASPDHFWSSPGSTVAGWGTAADFDPGTGPDRYRRARQFLAEWARAHDRGGSVALASFTFDPEQEGSVIAVPQETVTRRGAEWTTLDRSAAQLGAAAAAEASLVEIDPGDEEAFIRRVGKALSAISEGGISKVVVARAVDFELAQPADPHAVLSSLTADYPQGHTFLLSGLVGSSPELLVEQTANQVRSVALAGSAAATAGDEWLTASAKEAEEHRLTADWVESRLRLHAAAVVRSGVAVMEFGPALHLATAFAAEMDPSLGVLDVLSLLHPTPAVAGVPRDAAMSFIRREERGLRGRYGGPVGWFNTAGDGEFAIALRCALLTGRRARLLAGAGVVAGSDPASELEETDYKLATMRSALAAAIPADRVS